MAKVEESSDNSGQLTRLEWIQLHKDINVQDENAQSKLKRKFLENPFIPIGALVTVGALTFGLWNFRQGKHKMSQNMMRLRVGAQGFTVVALVIGVFLGGRKTT